MLLRAMDQKEIEERIKDLEIALTALPKLTGSLLQAQATIRVRRRAEKTEAEKSEVVEGTDKDKTYKHLLCGNCGSIVFLGEAGEAPSANCVAVDRNGTELKAGDQVISCLYEKPHVRHICKIIKENKIWFTPFWPASVDSYYDSGDYILWRQSDE